MALKHMTSAAFRMGHAMAPRLASRAAYRLFCSPPRGVPATAGEARLAEKLQPLVDSASAHRIATPDATIQAYLWTTTQPASRGRVLLLHGWTAQAIVMGMFVKPLRDAGFDVVAIDLPAHGRSTGRVLNMPIGARAVLAVADALGPFTGLVSHSFGGPIAALAIEGGSPLDRRLSLDRIVLVASPHALTRVTRGFGDALSFTPSMQAGFNAIITNAARRPIETINTGDFLNTSGLPALIVHDVDDADVPYADAEAIVAAAPRATLMPVKGMGHRAIVIAPIVVRASVRFLAGEQR